MSRTEIVLKLWRLWLIIAFHHIVFHLLWICPILILINEPWYVVVIPIITVIRIITGRERCILTSLENRWRRELGFMPLENNSFITHYYKITIDKRPRPKDF